ncbi:hypothetical protein CEV32_1548 [Brucella rhizosphaerae]|uniref:Uncharacterized protein n=1 Tax=Brucella rhizosphaerae TaxID=571254 RepID=A0A256F939_9HYPH|nr:hypothetical protein CEV32_1548 [Brucella rhizosphaerae]
MEEMKGAWRRRGQTGQSGAFIRHVIATLYRPSGHAKRVLLGGTHDFKIR